MENTIPDFHKNLIGYFNPKIFLSIDEVQPPNYGLSNQLPPRLAINRHRNRVLLRQSSIIRRCFRFVIDHNPRPILHLTQPVYLPLHRLPINRNSERHLAVRLLYLHHQIRRQKRRADLLAVPDMLLRILPVLFQNRCCIPAPQDFVNNRAFIFSFHTRQVL